MTDKVRKSEELRKYIESKNFTREQLERFLAIMLIEMSVAISDVMDNKQTPSVNVILGLKDSNNAYRVVDGLERNFKWAVFIVSCTKCDGKCKRVVDQPVTDVSELFECEKCGERYHVTRQFKG